LISIKVNAAEPLSPAPRQQWCEMRYFSCAMFEAGDPAPTRVLILAEDEGRAFVLGRSELARIHGATHAEFRENGRLLGVERLSRGADQRIGNRRALQAFSHAGGVNEARPFG
jgi:hypothetical protein